MLFRVEWKAHVWHKTWLFQNLGQKWGSRRRRGYNGCWWDRRTGKATGTWWIKEATFWDIWGDNKANGPLSCGRLRLQASPPTSIKLSITTGATVSEPPSPECFPELVSKCYYRHQNIFARDSFGLSKDLLRFRVMIHIGKKKES